MPSFFFKLYVMRLIFLFFEHTIIQTHTHTLCLSLSLCLSPSSVLPHFENQRYKFPLIIIHWCCRCRVFLFRFCFVQPDSLSIRVLSVWIQQIQVSIESGQFPNFFFYFFYIKIKIIKKKKQRGRRRRTRLIWKKNLNLHDFIEVATIHFRLEFAQFNLLHVSVWCEVCSCLSQWGT